MSLSDLPEDVQHAAGNIQQAVRELFETRIRLMALGVYGPVQEKGLTEAIMGLGQYLIALDPLDSVKFITELTNEMQPKMDDARMKALAETTAMEAQSYLRKQ